MADDIVQKLGIDTTNFEGNLKRANDVLQNFNEKILTSSASMSKFNEDGKLQEVVIKGLTETGKKYTAVIKNLENGIKRVDVKIVTDDLKRFEKALKQVSKEIAQGFKEEERELNTSVKSFGKITKEREREYKRQQRILKQISKEIAQGFKEEEREIQQAVKSFGKITKEREREYKNQQRILKQIAKEIAQGFKEATDAEIAEVKRAMNEARNANTERKRLAKEATDAAIAEVKRAMNAARNAEVERKRLAKERESQINKFISLELKLSKIHEQAGREAEAAARRQQAFRDRQTANAIATQRLDASRIGGGFFAEKFGQGVNLNKASSSELNNINSALAKITANIAKGKASLADYQVAFKAIGSGTVGTLSQQHLQLASDIIKVREAFGNVGKTGTEAGQSVLLSWRGVVRLFLVQTLHQTLNGLLNLFKANADEAARFSVGIGEILTISQQTSTTYDTLSSSIQDVSNRFGVAPLDAVAASYEAISNQVVDATRQHNFLTEALKFAAVTQTSAKTATNLLSSAINSYKLNATDAEKISSIFFEVINLGRVRAEEMGDTFGRVGSLASQMGITLEEVGASITVLTRQGIRYSEAYTLINNIVLKLLKPTGEFKDLLQQYGFASGEAAVKTLGFGNVLKILDTEAQKGNIRLGELLDEMRAIRGAVGLTGEGLQEFNKDLQQIQGAETIDRYRKALDIVNNTSGKQFLINTQQIKNYFTNVFGVAFIETFNSVIEKFGGGTNSARLFGNSLLFVATAATSYLTISKITGSQVLSLTKQYFILGETLKDSAGNAIKFGTALRGAFAASNLGVLAVTAVITGLVIAYTNASTRLEDLKNNAKRIYDELAESRENYMKRIRDSLNEESREYTNTLNSVVSTVGRFNANILAGLNARGQELEDTYKNIAKNVKSAFEAVSDVLRDRIKGIETSIDNFIKKSDEAFDKAKEIQKNIPQVRFEQELNAAPTDANKATLLQTRFEELRAQADKFLSEGKLDKAVELLDEAKKIGDQLGQTLTSIYRDSSKEAEKAFKDAGKAARDAAKAEEREQVKIATEIEQKLRSRGNTLTAADRDRLRRERETALESAQRARDAQARGGSALENAGSAEAARATINNQILDVLKQQEDTYRRIATQNEEARAAADAKLKAEKDAQATLDKSLTNVLEIKVDKTDTKALTEQFNAAREALKNNTQLSGQEKLDITLKLAELEKNALEQLENAKSVKSGEFRQKELTDIKEQYDKQLKLLQDQIAKEEQLLTDNAGVAKGNIDTLTKIIKDAEKAQTTQVIAQGRNGRPNPEDVNQLKLLRDTLKELESIKIGDTLTEGQTKQLEKAVELIGKLRVSGGRSVLLDKESIGILITSVSKLNEIAAKGTKIGELREQFNTLNESLTDTQTKFRDIPGIVDVFSNSVESAAKRSAREIQALNDRVDALNRSLRESARIPLSGSGAALGGAAFLNQNFGGRMAFYANGGRGMDRIPAMLRNDEFVMSAGATRRNYSQFVALNAGQTPKNFNNGGSVTNIGDVNVTMVGSGNTETDARSLANSIRREIRLRRI